MPPVRPYTSEFTRSSWLLIGKEVNGRGKVGAIMGFKKGNVWARFERGPAKVWAWSGQCWGKDHAGSS